jgi:hypothetical protein
MTVHTHPSPFPLRTSLGVIVDETCRCGHARTEHSDTVVAYGHSACSMLACDCFKFTWIAFRYVGEGRSSLRSLVAGFLAGALLLGAVPAIAADMVASPNAPAEVRSCITSVNTMRNAGKGLLTVPEMRDGFKRALATAQAGKSPAVTQATSRMLAAVTQEDAAAISATVPVLMAACTAALPGGR